MSQLTPAIVGGLSLAIKKFDSLEVERFTQNGQQRNVHYIIKNHPFSIELALVGKNDRRRTVDFRDLTIESALLYDSPTGDADKEVTSVRVKPLQFRGVLSDADPTRFVIEFTVGVLSSHHEDMNFKLRIAAVDATTRQRFDNLVLYTEPMCVISKPEVLEKKKNPRKRKRPTANDMLLEKLARLEELQRKSATSFESFKTRVTSNLEKLSTQQQNILQNQQQQQQQQQQHYNLALQSQAAPSKQLALTSSGQHPQSVAQRNTRHLLRSSSNTPLPSSAAAATAALVKRDSLNGSDTPPSRSRIRSSLTSSSGSSQSASELSESSDSVDASSLTATGSEAQQQFDSAFQQLIRHYHELSADERPAKIRKMLGAISTEESSELSEILDTVWAEGLRVQTEDGNSLAWWENSVSTNDNDSVNSESLLLPTVPNGSWSTLTM